MMRRPRRNHRLAFKAKMAVFAIKGEKTPIELALENDCVRRAQQGGFVAERKTMIDNSAKLSVSRQAFLLGTSRSSASYQPRPVSDANLTLMHRIDKPHRAIVFEGRRML